MEPKRESEISSIERTSRGGDFVSSPRPSKKQRRTDGQAEPWTL